MRQLILFYNVTAQKRMHILSQQLPIAILPANHPAKITATSRQHAKFNANLMSSTQFRVTSFTYLSFFGSGESKLKSNTPQNDASICRGCRSYYPW
jgi:hypothetical protein